MSDRGRVKDARGPGGAPVRERLLAAAGELFYQEGVQTVGVERIAQRAGASKKSLYAVFRSKEELVLAYLQERRAELEILLTGGIDHLDTPHERILGIFDVLGKLFAMPGYNGCPFLAASAEAVDGSLVEQAHTAYRAWVRALFTNLATDAGLPDPAAVAGGLHLLYDAAAVAAKADKNPSAAATARTAAAAVLGDLP